MVDEEQGVVLDGELSKLKVLVGGWGDSAVETDAAVTELGEVDECPARRVVGVEVEIVGLVAQEEASVVDIGNTARSILLWTNGKSVVVRADSAQMDRAGTAQRNNRKDL